MRFLCLHGRGTSANIFKSQTEAFRKLVAGNHSFDFIDGPFLDGPAAGIDLFYAPPYYKLYEQMTLDSIRDGHQWLADYIDGTRNPLSFWSSDSLLPFQAQLTNNALRKRPLRCSHGLLPGCSLASSFLLAHKAANPYGPPPFKAAIFICGGIPLDVLSSHGIEVTQEAYDWDQSSKIALMNQASSEAILREGKHRWGAKFAFANYPDNGYPYGALNGAKSSMVFGIDVAKIPRKMKISIPTVHVFGSRDPRFPASVTLAQFCDERVRRTFDHRSGHEIPRTTSCSIILAESVQWCTKMAGL